MKRISRLIIPVLFFGAFGVAVLVPSFHRPLEAREYDALSDEWQKEKKEEAPRGGERDEISSERGSVVGGIMRILFGTTSTPESLGESRSATTSPGVVGATPAAPLATTSSATTTDEEDYSPSIATGTPVKATTTVAVGTPLPVAPTSTSSALGRTIGLYPGALVWLPKSIVNPYQFETLSALWTGRLYTAALLLALFGTALVTGLLDRVFARRDPAAVGAFFARTRQ
ncbi:MAG: hypothetical protein V4674_04265 [Patescibacteria group bacterium]